MVSEMLLFFIHLLALKTLLSFDDITYLDTDATCSFCLDGAYFQHFSQKKTQQKW